jgi:hypothetical protein
MIAFRPVDNSDRVVQALVGGEGTSVGHRGGRARGLGFLVFVRRASWAPRAGVQRLRGQCPEVSRGR